MEANTYWFCNCSLLAWINPWYEGTDNVPKFIFINPAWMGAFPFLRCIHVCFISKNDMRNLMRFIKASAVLHNLFAGLHPVPKVISMDDLILMMNWIHMCVLHRFDWSSRSNWSSRRNWSWRGSNLLKCLTLVNANSCTCNFFPDDV